MRPFATAIRPDATASVYQVYQGRLASRATWESALGPHLHRLDADRHAGVHRRPDEHRLAGARPGRLLRQPVRLCVAPGEPGEDPHLGQGRFVLIYNRLERGQFKLPRMNASTMAVEIDATQIAMLLDGIDFGHVRRPTVTARKRAPLA